MESDNEIAGDKNVYTAPFWQYDSRIGRRWNVDPVVKPFESPYACFNSNPILYADPDGRDGIATVKGDVITIKSVIYITGAKATQKKAQLMQSSIMHVWGKDFNYKDGDKNYKVKYDIQVKVAPTNKRDVSKLSAGENLVELIDESKEEFRSVVNGDGDNRRRQGKWGDDETYLTYAHEVGHLLGNDDLYYSKTINGKRKCSNYEGVEEFDLMGAKGLYKGKSKVTQNTINAMSKYILENNKDGENVIIDASEVRFGDNSKLKKKK